MAVGSAEVLLLSLDYHVLCNDLRGAKDDGWDILDRAS